MPDPDPSAAAWRHLTDPVTPLSDIEQRRRTLTRKEVAAQGTVGPVDQWTPEELELVMDDMRGMLTARLRGIVYAEDYARDVRTVNVEVTVHPSFHWHDPGRRIWWKPWRRHPDVARTVTTTETTTVQVDITRIAWAKVPDAPPFPKEYGRPVTFVEYEGTQHHGR